MVFRWRTLRELQRNRVELLQRNLVELLRQHDQEKLHLVYNVHIGQYQKSIMYPLMRRLASQSFLT